MKVNRLISRSLFSILRKLNSVISSFNRPFASTWQEQNKKRIKRISLFSIVLMKWKKKLFFMSCLLLSCHVAHSYSFMLNTHVAINQSIVFGLSSLLVWVDKWKGKLTEVWFSLALREVFRLRTFLGIYWTEKAFIVDIFGLMGSSSNFFLEKESLKNSLLIFFQIFQILL